MTSTAIRFFLLQWARRSRASPIVASLQQNSTRYSGCPLSMMGLPAALLFFGLCLSFCVLSLNIPSNVTSVAGNIDTMAQEGDDLSYIKFVNDLFQRQFIE
ncbi:hypothetical protein HAX54_029844 [Datura stramonium]|uniref:Transmembrane protein n=1 Tax=Datura stramonium TaxID=4076 RepID=A0ABS8V7J2_DATST|nr:hypothetical protein [Datura stramonium]